MRTGEMALRNPAFCYGRTDAGPKSKEHYQKALAAFPDSAVAGTALRMVDSASSRGLPANPVSFPGSCAMGLFDIIECEYPIPDGQH
ncbi:MAG: hypothetical protein ABSH28_15545, partial [Acidobacteriota bacterium]